MGFVTGNGKKIDLPPVITSEPSDLKIDDSQIPNKDTPQPLEISGNIPDADSILWKDDFTMKDINAAKEVIVTMTTNFTTEQQQEPDWRNPDLFSNQINKQG